MALSMGEERILADIAHHLVQEDPALAQRFESFGRRSWRRVVDQRDRVRLRRWGVIGALVLLAVLFMTMIVSVAREPGKPVEQQQPRRPPAGPAVVVPPVKNVGAPVQVESTAQLLREIGP